jgi:ATP-binding cassette subfamily B (MDR/TAP) protein 8
MCYLIVLIRLKALGMNLMENLSLQGLLTFTYISLLSAVGENVALQMRTRLFDSLLRQDIAFFDTHKTGELVDR